MRELILNHASLTASSTKVALDSLADISSGIAYLLANCCVSSSLRAAMPLQEIYLRPHQSLDRAIFALLKVGKRDESALLCRLATKIPLLSGLPDKVVDRFKRCRPISMSLSDAAPLILCVCTNSVAVGFPSQRRFDRDQLSVVFDEATPTQEMVRTRGVIDNLSRSFHAKEICRRYYSVRNLATSASRMWRAREQIFPGLIFGPDVKANLAGLDSRTFRIVVGKLEDLNLSALRWKAVGGPAPQWTTRVTPESERVRNDRRLRAARRFRSAFGAREEFLWHARFGRSGRIHLRYISRLKKVEIGYVGVHLPL